jgi:hypothetical protein
MVNKVQVEALIQQHADEVKHFQQIKQAHTSALNAWAAQKQAVVNLAITVKGQGGEVEVGYGAILQRSSGIDELDEQFCKAARVLSRFAVDLRFAERNLKEARAARRALEAFHN